MVVMEMQIRKAWLDLAWLKASREQLSDYTLLEFCLLFSPSGQDAVNFASAEVKRMFFIVPLHLLYSEASA